MMLDLINYTQLADSRVIDVMLKSEKALPAAQNLFSHILNSQHIWINRIRKEEVLYDRFQLHPVNEFNQIHLAAFKELLEIFHSYDLKAPVIYSNSSGESFVNSISDIIYHIVNHSTYHRAQIASDLRTNGIDPPITDYIAFKREGLI